MKTRKFTAELVVDNKLTGKKIQCIATDETHFYSKIWLEPETGKKYYITKMYRKSVFHEI